MLERVERVARADPSLLNVTGSQSQGKFKVTPWSAEIVCLKRYQGRGEDDGKCLLHALLVVLLRSY